MATPNAARTFKIYRILYDGSVYLVAATEFQESIKTWREFVAEEWGADYTGDEEPESVELLDADFPVLRQRAEIPEVFGPGDPPRGIYLEGGARTIFNTPSLESAVAWMDRIATHKFSSELSRATAELVRGALKERLEINASGRRCIPSNVFDYAVGSLSAIREVVKANGNVAKGIDRVVDMLLLGHFTNDTVVPPNPVPPFPLKKENEV